jgi:hypothetical protein
VSTLDDYTPVIIGSIFAFASAFAIMIIGRHMNVFDKTRHQSTLTTVNVGNVQEDMKELKKMHDDLKAFFDRKFEKFEEENKSEFRRGFEKLDKMSAELYNLGWRVSALEGSGNRGRSVPSLGGPGGGGGALLVF